MNALSVFNVGYRMKKKHFWIQMSKRSAGFHLTYHDWVHVDGAGAAGISTFYPKREPKTSKVFQALNP